MDNSLIQSVLRDLTVLKQEKEKRGKKLTSKEIDSFVKKATKGAFKDLDQVIASQVALEESVAGRKNPTLGKTLLDGTRAFLQGATLGFSDEAEAGVRYMLSMGDLPYDVALDIIRQEQDQFAQENPNTALGLELAGGVASALTPAGGIARGGQAVQYGSKVLSNLLNPGSLAARGVQGLGVGKTGRLAGVAKSPITSGAVQGGVDAAAYNLGTSENIVTPDNPLSLQGQTQGLDVERLGTDTALGVGLGGVGGKVGQAVAGYVAPKLRSVQDAFSGGSGGRIPPSVSAPMRGMPDDERGALDRILKRLEEGNITPEELRFVQQRLQGMNKGDIATFYDRMNINPETMTQRIGNPIDFDAKASLAMGEGSTLYGNTIGQRQLTPNVQQRFEGDIGQTMGRTYDEADVTGIQDETRRLAKQFYQQQGTQPVDGPNIQRFVNLPYTQRAYGEAREALDLENMMRPADRQTPVPDQLTTPLTVDQLDATQKAFRDQMKIDQRANQEGQMLRRSTLLNQITDDALTEAGGLVKEYQIARQLYSRGSLVEPFEEGLSDLMSSKMTPQKVANKYNKLKGEKKLAYRSGMVQALLDKYSRTTAKSADLAKEFRNDTLVQKLRSVSSNEAVDDLMQRVGVEEAFASATFLGPRSGSPTAPLTVAERGMAPNSFDVAARVATDPSGGAITAVNEGANAARRLQDALDFEQGQRTKAAMGRQLMSRGPQADLLTDQLEALQRSQAQDDLARRYGLRMLPRTAPMLQNQFLSPLLYGD
jgi:hypothetical protein